MTLQRKSQVAFLVRRFQAVDEPNRVSVELKTNPKHHQNQSNNVKHKARKFSTVLFIDLCVKWKFTGPKELFILSSLSNRMTSSKECLTKFPTMTSYNDLIEESIQVEVRWKNTLY